MSQNGLKEMEYEYTASGVRMTLMRGSLPLPPKKRLSDKFHTHAWYELFYADGCETDIYFEQEKVLLTPRHFLLMAPETVHYAEEVPDPSKLLVCTFTAEFSEKSDAGASLADFLRGAPYRTFAADEMCMLLMRGLCASLREGDGASAGSYLVALLYRGVSICNKTAVAKAQNSDSRMGRIYKIEQMLFGFYNQELPLSFLAEQLHLSERQLSRVFKQQYGVGYREKNRELRMRSAARRLMKGESVKEIAKAVGYSSESAFYAAFKSYFGLSPAAYRSEKRKK